MPDLDLTLAPDATHSQLARNLDICLSVPRLHPDVADFLFAAIAHNPLHPQYPLRLDALTTRDELLCINLYRRISEKQNPFCPASSTHEPAFQHYRLPENKDGHVEEDLLFFPVAFVHGFIFGYFKSQRHCDNSPPTAMDPWTDQSFGRFVFHTATKAFYMAVYGGDPPYIGMRVKFPRGSDYTDFLDVIVPPGDYGRSNLPTESPLIVSTPKFPNNSIVKHKPDSSDSTETLSRLIDEAVSAGAAQPRQAQPVPICSKTAFEAALDRLATSLCKNSYSPGLRSDSQQGTISFTGHCEYFITRTSNEKKQLMRASMIDAMQLATFFTMLDEPYIALHRPPDVRRIAAPRPARRASAGVIAKRRPPRSKRVPTRGKRAPRKIHELDASEISELPSDDDGRCSS